MLLSMLLPLPLPLPPPVASKGRRRIKTPRKGLPDGNERRSSTRDFASDNGSTDSMAGASTKIKPPHLAYQWFRIRGEDQTGAIEAFGAVVDVSYIGGTWIYATDSTRFNIGLGTGYNYLFDNPAPSFAGRAGLDRVPL